MSEENRLNFLAWDDERKKMWCVLALHVSDLNGRLPRAEVNDGRVTEWRPLKNLHIRQSTGLTDRNGVEIFDGDVLGEVGISEKELMLEWSTWKVVYKDAAFWYVPLVPSNHHEDDQDGYLLGDDTLARHPVIGSIYDNPELMEVAGNKRRRGRGRA